MIKSSLEQEQAWDSRRKSILKQSFKSTKSNQDIQKEERSAKGNKIRMSFENSYDREKDGVMQFNL